MNFRHFLSWKGLFYDLLLPVLRRLGPARADAALAVLGRSSLLWPPQRRAFDAGLQRGAADGDRAALRPRLAANAVRFAARDYLLDGPDDAAVLSRFDVTGAAEWDEALASGTGAILVGSHLGGHIAGLHWLYRRGSAPRLLVQRPRHISRWLNRQFDADGPHAQSGFFLRRDLPPGQCVERLLRARAAVRAGLPVYLNGDIPWGGPNARPGRFLGQPSRFLSVWADLAVATRAPVFVLFCTHRPSGRYALTIAPLGTIVAGQETEAVGRYLARLEAEIAAHPADAVAHLLWPCYGPTTPRAAHRPSRRVAAVSPQ